MQRANPQEMHYLPHVVLQQGLPEEGVGVVSANDVVIIREGIVGKVASFWQEIGGGAVYASISAYRCINGDTKLRATDNSHDVVCDARDSWRLLYGSGTHLR